MAEESQQERTEEPTEKRRREYREKGQVAQSKEVNTALLFLASLLLWYFYMPAFWQDLQVFITHIWRGAGTFAAEDPHSITSLLHFIVSHLIGLFWPLFLTVLVIGILASFVQFGWLLTLKPLEPDLTKLDPIKGAAKFVSKRSFVEIVKSLVKVIIVALIAFFTLHGRIEQALRLVDADLSMTLGFIASTFFFIMTMSCIVLLVLAVLDYMFVRWEME
jgi:flagellar biosynthetic protein FlhB